MSCQALVKLPQVQEWIYSLDKVLLHIMSYIMKVDFLRQNSFLEFERKRMVLTGKIKEKSSKS